MTAARRAIGLLGGWAVLLRARTRLSRLGVAVTCVESFVSDCAQCLSARFFEADFTGGHGSAKSEVQDGVCLWRS